MHFVIQPSASHYFARYLLCLIVKKHHMVAVPTNRTSNMKSDLREECQQRRYFVADDFGRMIVPVIHERNAAIFIHCGIRQRKLRTACRIGLNAYSEHLALNARLNFFEVIRFREYRIDALTIADTRTESVRRHILES